MDRKIQKLMRGLYDIRREAEDPPVILKYNARKSAVEVIAPPIDVPDVPEPPKSRWKKFVYLIKRRFKK